VRVGDWSFVMPHCLFLHFFASAPYGITRDVAADTMELGILAGHAKWLFNCGFAHARALLFG